MSIAATALFLILSFIAEILGTIGGFGSSTFFVPVANYFLDFQTVLGITAVFHVFSNISKIALFKNGLDKRILFSIGIPAVTFVIIGAFTSKYVNVRYLQLVLSLFLIGLSILFLIKKELKLSPNKKNSFIGGSLSGFFAGLLGTGGAIRGITMAAFSVEKSVFVATSAAIDLAVDSSRMFIYYFNGYIHKHDLYLIPFLIIIGFVGTYIGKIILDKIPQEKFRVLVLVLILFVGVTLILKFLGISHFSE
ncbi:MAG TPA: sulfite exporter TauE/SafE family protein [Chitinophagales bacterium]|nr:sulfite exporter TauE/SafE family protein [Chitinophagales bacterium]